jgi:hypothetical protein
MTLIIVLIMSNVFFAGMFFLECRKNRVYKEVNTRLFAMTDECEPTINALLQRIETLENDHIVLISENITQYPN